MRRQDGNGFEEGDPNDHKLQEKGLPQEQRTQEAGRFLRGRQIAYMIYEYFRITCAKESILNFSDLMNTTLRGDDVKDLIQNGTMFFYPGRK